MGTALNFLAGCLAGGVVALCGDGGDIGERPPHAVVCRPGDVWCMAVASATATRTCRLMPSGLVVYARPAANGEIWRDLEGRGLLDVGEWLEGEDCDQ